MKRRVSNHLENWMARIPFRISRHTWDDFSARHTFLGLIACL